MSTDASLSAVTHPHSNFAVVETSEALGIESSPSPKTLEVRLDSRSLLSPIALVS